MFTLASAGAQVTISHHYFTRYYTEVPVNYKFKKGLFWFSVYLACLARCLFFVRNATHTVQKHL